MPPVAVFLAGVVFAALGHVTMKKGALRGRHRSVLASLLDPYVGGGWALMLASTVASTIALKALPLHLTVALLPLGHVVVVALSLVFLSERMRLHHLWGGLLIAAGIALFTLGTP